MLRGGHLSSRNKTLLGVNTELYGYAHYTALNSTCTCYDIFVHRSPISS